jgi:sugar phosphate isomerase/epimerase
MKPQHSRRDFLRLSAVGTIGTFMLPSALNKGIQSSNKISINNVGLQVYTIRDQIRQDTPGSLKKVADAGYKLLELADYNNGKFYGYSPSELRKIVNDLGMEVISNHITVENAENSDVDPQKIVDDHAELGSKYALKAWIESRDRSIDYFKRMVGQLNDYAEKTKGSGVKFGYHNHNFEFSSIDGTVPYYDIILPGLNKDLALELDLFWVTKAGQDPVEIFKKYPGRFELFHVKDMFTKQDPFFDTEGVKDFAPVGEGLIDFKRIFAANDIAGVKYLFVEQDSTPDNLPFDAIQKSYRNLKIKLFND